MEFNLRYISDREMQEPFSGLKSVNWDFFVLEIFSRLSWVESFWQDC